MSLSNKMFKGLLWSGAQRLSVDAIQFILGIVLARILTPKEYGTIGILLVFISVSNVFIDSGFNSALIQKQDRNENDKSTTLFFNLSVAFICYLILYFSSPFVASFYDIPQLKDLLRVLALVLLINASFAVPNSLFSIKLDFKTLTKVTFTAALISGVIAITLAYKGFGVWALVAQTLIRAFVNSVLMWFYVKWKPNWNFSLESFKNLYSYGINILIASLIATSVSHVSGLFIAKLFNPRNLGIFTRGTQFADTAFFAINTILKSVLFPGLSQVQHDHQKLVSHNKTIIKTATLVVMPLFLLLATLSNPIIKILLTDKWLPAAPIMQIYCIARFITIICSINMNMLYVIGRTDLELKQQYVKTLIRIVLLIIGLQFGILYVALAELTGTVLHFFVNTYFPGKILGYGARKQLKDIGPILICGVIMSAIILLTTNYLSNEYLKLILGSSAGLITYFLCIRALKVDEYKILLDKLKELKAQKRSQP